MVQTIRIIGLGRVGSAVAARLRERGFDLTEGEADLVLLCVPDRAIAEVAAGVPTGPWIAHTSGATPLSALDPHERRFGLHPLQSFTRARGPEQLDGAYAAVSGESDEAREVGSWLARELGLEPFALDDSERALYHAGAVVAASYLVTLHQAAADLVRGRRSAARGARSADAARDRERLRADRAGRARRLGDGRGAPGSDPGAPARAGASLSGAGRRDRGAGRPMKIVRTIAELPESDGTVGLVPTMGAFHAGHLALFAAAREENDVVVASLFVNPAQFGPAEDLDRYPRDEERDAKLAEEAGVDVLFAPSAEEMYPDGYATWVDVGELGDRLEGEFRPDHFRGVATVCLKLFNIVRPTRAYFGQKDAQQAAVVKQLVRDLNLELEIRVVPTVRDEDGLALSSRNAYLSPEEHEAALALPRGLWAGRDAFVTGSDPAKEAQRFLNSLDVDYVEVADLDGQKVLAAAVRVGKTRLIDNVVLEGETK